VVVDVDAEWRRAVPDDGAGPRRVLGPRRDSGRPRPAHVCRDRTAEAERLERTVTTGGRAGSGGTANG